jgi:hypothetical protein
MAFVDSNGTSVFLLTSVNEVTGSLFITLFFIVLVLIIIALMLRIPIEFTAIIVLPFLISVTAYESSLMSVTGVFLIYIALLLANNFWFVK